MFSETFIYNLTLTSSLSSSLTKLYSKNYFNLIELELLKRNSESTTTEITRNKSQDLDKSNNSKIGASTSHITIVSYLNQEQLKEIGDVLEVLGHSNDLDIIPPKHLIAKLQKKKKHNNEIESSIDFKNNPVGSYDLDIQDVFLEVGDEVIAIFVRQLSRLITISFIPTIGLSSNNFIIEERIHSLEFAVNKVKRYICDFSEMLSIILSTDFNELLNIMKFTKEEAALIFYFILDYFHYEFASHSQIVTSDSNMISLLIK